MLVLSRNKGDTVMIGSEVTVKVIGIYGDRVQLGFDAPATTIIYRGEIYELIERQKLATSRAVARSLESD